MKKRILSILLLCCMVLGLLPTTVFANNDGTKAIQLGTSGISGYDMQQITAMTIFILAHGITAPSNGVCWITKTNMPNAQEGGRIFFCSLMRCLGQGIWRRRI